VVDPDAGRLVVASVLRLHVARRLGAGAPCEDLVETAHRLRVPGDHFHRTYGITLDPDYPGVTTGVEEVRGGRRLVLACLADRHGEPAAVITTLVLGRPPRVVAAPPGVGLPADRSRP
jgi:hypothetical protein